MDSKQIGSLLAKAHAVHKCEKSIHEVYKSNEQCTYQIENALKSI